MYMHKFIFERRKEMSVLKKKGSTCLLVLGLIFSFTLNVGKIVKLPIDYVYGASNISAFEWKYFASYMDGRGKVSHSLGKGTAQLKVDKCYNYSSSSKGTVYLRKAQKASPGYKNCGSIKFYKPGTYSFGKVGKGSYWLFIKGGNAKCYKSARGKVQNK